MNEANIMTENEIHGKSEFEPTALSIKNLEIPDHQPSELLKR